MVTVMGTSQAITLEGRIHNSCCRSNLLIKTDWEPGAGLMSFPQSPQPSSSRLVLWRRRCGGARRGHCQLPFGAPYCPLATPNNGLSNKVTQSGDSDFPHQRRRSRASSYPARPFFDWCRCCTTAGWKFTDAFFATPVTRPEKTFTMPRVAHVYDRSKLQVYLTTARHHCRQ